jgi:aspartate/methionine/tyrosine aminotransferase
VFSTIASRFRSPINPLYQERDRLLRQGETLVDLISGNVNLHGIAYPQSALEEILVEASQRARIYRPDPLGQPPAREAIREYYLKQGIEFPADRILLTPGTSLSYWYCFKLLADPGEEILSPTPTYPLFDHIAELSGVRMVPYRLDEQRDWAIDFDCLERVITPRSRAVILISPHNPTGRVASTTEVTRLAEIASRHDLAIISDEVFGEFLLDPSLSFPRVASTGAPLVFTLNGFSKMFALPGMKIGWMAISGETERVEHAIEAIETISDTFLPVGEIQQAAVPEVFRRGEGFLREYVETIRSRANIALETLSRSPVLRVVPPQGGFYLSARIADGDSDEEAVAVGLLKRHRILTHPGYFYDLDPPHLVLSIVAEPPVLAASLDKLVRFLSERGS